MSVGEDLNLKIKTIQNKFKENENTIISSLAEYQNIFSKESQNFFSKIQKKCNERISSLSKVKDENKRTFFIESSNDLDNLLKAHEELVNKLISSLKSLKTFLLNDPNIFQNKNEDEGENEKNNKLVIKCTDDCGKAKGILRSKEGDNLQILEVNRITMDDFHFLFKDNLKEKEQNTKEDENKETNNDEEIKIKKLKFKKSILLDINFGDYFPNLESLSISDCQIGYDISPKINFNNIKSLSLEGIDLVNENFEELLIYLLKGEKNGDYIGKNLESLSVKKNRISRILFLVGDTGKKDIKNEFLKLKYLNLSYNNLFDYYIDQKKKLIFPNVELLDLTSNNITSPFIMKNLIEKKGKETIILASKNLSVIKNNKMRLMYSEYLIQKLQDKNEKYKIKSLVLEGMFGRANKDKLFKMDLSQYNHSLVELNLSFNTINDKEIMSIFEKNNNLENLKRLNLSSNVLTDEFFKNINKKNYFENYKNLKLLNLSCNPIAFNEADTYKTFILNCQNLESLILKHTFIGEDINHYLKNKIIRFTAKKSGQKVPDLDNKGKEMESFIDKDKFLKNNSKCYITVSYVIKQKYISYVNKFFPYLLERIKLEED